LKVTGPEVTPGEAWRQVTSGRWVTVGSTSVATQVACSCSCVMIRDCCSMQGSTILNSIYHLCALDVVASGIDNIIVQTLRVSSSPLTLFPPIRLPSSCLYSYQSGLVVLGIASISS
jgi:hypothetical protein